VDPIPVQDSAFSIAPEILQIGGFGRVPNYLDGKLTSIIPPEPSCSIGFMTNLYVTCYVLSLEG